MLLDIHPGPPLFSSLMNIRLSKKQLRFTGPAGTLVVRPDDLVTHRLAMLLEGQCEGLGATHAAQKYGLSRQRYYQVLEHFYEQGAPGLELQTPGPKHAYRRTDLAVRLAIRCRFLDPDCSAAVIAQKIRQQDLPIAERSVQRIIADYGLQKKTLRP